VVDYGGTFHPIWNGLADLIWILFAIVVVRTPTERLAHGWRSKIYWILGGTIFNVYAPGLFIPVGVVVAWALFVKRHRRTDRCEAPTAVALTANEGYPFYADRGPVATR
jgi:hypothetical protein